MTTNDIDAIRELERTILPAPWRVGEMKPTGPDLWQLPILLDRDGPDGPDTIVVCAVEYETQGYQYPHDDARRDAEFIAAARTHVPALCDEVEQLRSQMADARYTVDQVLAKRDAYAVELESLRAEVAEALEARDVLRLQLDAARAMADELRDDLRAADDNNANLQQHIADIRTGAF